MRGRQSCPTIVEVDDGTEEHEATSDNSLNTNIDYLVVGVWEFNTDVRLFINGQAENPNMSGAGANDINGGFANALDLTIGAGPGGFLAWIGEIDEVRVENTVRSAAWIQTSYTNQDDPLGFITLGTERVIPVGN